MSITWRTLLLSVLPGLLCLGATADDFIRGDSNGDGEINISDVIFTLSYLYRGGSVPPCIAATDSNGNGRLNVIDVMFILSYLYRGGPAPPDLLTCDL